MPKNLSNDLLTCLLCVPELVTQPVCAHAVYQLFPVSQDIVANLVDVVSNIFKL